MLQVLTSPMLRNPQDRCVPLVAVVFDDRTETQLAWHDMDARNLRMLRVLSDKVGGGLFAEAIAL